VNLTSDLPAVAATNGRIPIVPVVTAMIALAVLDLIGAALARSWADHRSAISLVAGVVVFGLLFVVYGKSLSYAELSTVTIGWVVMLQIGVVVLDRLRGVTIPPGRMSAIALILVLQAYITASDLTS
jgi:hypothetical protein